MLFLATRAHIPTRRGLVWCALVCLSIGLVACRAFTPEPEAFPIPAEPDLDTALSSEQVLKTGGTAPRPDEAMPDETLPSTESALDDLGLKWDPIPEMVEAQGARRPATPAAEAPARGYASLFGDVAPDAGPVSAAPDDLLSSGAVSEPARPDPTGAAAAASQAASVSSRLAAAWRSYYDESPASARALFEALAAEEPARADIQLGLGQCLLYANELESAQKRFALASLLAPQDVSTRFYEGVMAYQTEQFEVALNIWQPLSQALATRPTSQLHHDVAWLSARALLGLQRRGEAETAFRQALSCESGSTRMPMPPDPVLEWPVSGKLPGANLQPVWGRQPVDLGPGLIFSASGVLWRLSDRSILRERLSYPPEGWLDEAGVPDPRGRRLLVLSRSPQGEHFLFLQDPDGQRELLLASPVQAIVPAWSPDGTLIALVMDGGEPRLPRLYLYRLSTRDLEPVFWPEGPVRDPVFATDGQLVLAVQLKTGTRLFRWALGDPRGEALPLRAVTARPGEDISSDGLNSKPSAQEDPQADAQESSRAMVPARRSPPPPRAPVHMREPWQASSPESSATWRQAVEARELDQPSTQRPEGGAGLKSDGRRDGERPVQDAAARKRVLLRGSKTPVLPTEQDALAPRPLFGDRLQPTVAPSSDGLRLAYVVAIGALRQVVLHEPNAENELRVSPRELDCHSPRFDHSGQRLSFLCREGELQRLFVYDRRSGNPERVFGEALSVSAPHWFFPVVPETGAAP